MRLVCPCCGGIASLDAWSLDQDARATVAAIVSLPQGLPSQAMRYLGLFRRADSPRGLSWGRARRLVAELAELVNAQELSWDNNPAHRNRVVYWEHALAVILEREGLGKIKRPLMNHNLLRCIAAEQAAKEAEAERTRIEELRRYPMARKQETSPGHNIELGRSKSQAILKKLRERQLEGDNGQDSDS